MGCWQRFKRVRRSRHWAAVFQDSFHPGEGQGDFHIFRRFGSTLEKQRTGGLNLGQAKGRPASLHGLAQGIHRQGNRMVRTHSIKAEQSGRKKSSQFPGSHMPAADSRKGAARALWQAGSRGNYRRLMHFRPSREARMVRRFICQGCRRYRLAVALFAEQIFEKGSHDKWKIKRGATLETTPSKSRAKFQADLRLIFTFVNINKISAAFDYPSMSKAFRSGCRGRGVNQGGVRKVLCPGAFLLQQSGAERV